jgi:hypothetical protein
MEDGQVNRILKDLCEEHNLPVELMHKMLREERNVRHLKLRRGITERLRMLVEKSLGVKE